MMHLSTMPTIHVTETVKQRLDEIKECEDHTSYDSVIRTLAQEHEQ